MFARFAIPFFLSAALVALPLVVFVLCRWLLPRRTGRRVALACTFIIWCLTGYGFLFGFQQFRVRHVEYASADLPAAFDGYRIVHFSDAHVGTYSGSRQWMLRRAVDSINAQHPDMIAFTGDLQNLSPDELPEHMPLLRRLKARDGVFSVLGNHDYPMYLRTGDAAVKAAFSEQTCRQERQMGWMLLLNDHRVIRRGGDSIVIAGMENWGTARRMPRQGDVGKTLSGLQLSADSARQQAPFIVMLQHDPTAWRSLILPHSPAQLTLSGHTHGGQMAFCGWSPVALVYSEWGGTTLEGARALHVSTGLGGLIPFRLGLPGEVVVVTLRKK